MKKLFLALAVLSSVMTSTAKTLVVYYSFTNDYAADNYAIGSALISVIRNNPQQSGRCLVISGNRSGQCQSCGLQLHNHLRTAVVEQYGGSVADLALPQWQ